MFTKEDWNEYLEARDRGEVCEVDEEIFDYFLGVLPPAYMFKEVTLPGGRSVKAVYGFAEGYEPITAFWDQGGKHYCQRTAEMNRC